MTILVTIERDSETIGVVCGTRMDLLATGEVEPRFCFKCRINTLHFWRLRGEVGSYYDPIWVCECRRCGRDNTRFPW